MVAPVDWAHVVLYAGAGLAGLGVLLVGIGAIIVSNALAALLRRVDVTLDEVDRQIVALGAPIARTLDHLDSVADTADVTLSHAGGVVTQVEILAERVVKVANLTAAALTPPIVNTGATLTGISAGLRRLFGGSPSDAPDTVRGA